MEQIAVLRAQWLAQLSETIESAQRVAWRLRTDDRRSAEARELYGKLEAARVELDTLRGLNRPATADVEPDWMKLLGWGVSPSDLPD